MKQNNLKKWIVGGAAALMLTTGVAWTADSTYASSLMQETSQATLAQVASTLRFVHNGAGRSGGIGNQQELLAAALNISVEQLDAAKATAHSAAIDQAVAEGLMTQEQADAIRARGENSGHIGRVRSDSIDYDSLLANALGISVEQLEAAEDTAFTNGLNQAVAEGIITQEQADLNQAKHALNDYLEESTAETREEAIQQAVQDGVITQEQADQFQNGGRGFGRQGARGRGFGGPNGNEAGGARFQAPANAGDDASSL